MRVNKFDESIHTQNDTIKSRSESNMQLPTNLRIDSEIFLTRFNQRQKDTTETHDA